MRQLSSAAGRTSAAMAGGVPTVVILLLARKSNGQAITNSRPSFKGQPSLIAGSDGMKQNYNPTLLMSNPTTNHEF
jgi:hypothetical protein